MKKIYGLTIASVLALALTGCAGGSSSSLSTAKTDKDKDGVMDISDQCPNTKPGVKVSADGCEIFAGITLAEAATLNEKEVCNVAKLGIDQVIANAKLYNEQAKKEKVEFRRLGVNNSDLIISVEEGIKAGAKEVNPKDFKGKDSKTKLEINYAAHRACTFGLAALQYKEEGKSTWRNEVPGDGFKY
ncbi:MAG: hypothetical protein IE909_05150 [Campylobacterales bacterium]|nr:hypothetical protein [Campylobacterales bacterium]